MNEETKMWMPVAIPMFVVGAPFMAAGAVADKIKAAPTAIQNYRYDRKMKKK